MSLNYKVTKKDFRVISVVGKGAYGKVMLVKKLTGQDKGKYYAMKSQKKDKIIKLNLCENIKTERNILAKINHPMVVKLHYAFQDKDHLYLILDYCPGGELFFYLQTIGRFREDVAQFYAANMLLSLSHLHKNDILYKDLKPENILVCKDGYLKLTDFGLSSLGNETQKICGTPEYLSPEVLYGQQYQRSAEWWSFGCVIYEMLTGIPPFMTNSQKNDDLYNIIKFQQPDLSFNYLSKDSIDLLEKLLQKDPILRLGSSKEGSNDIMNHPWFKQIDWESLRNKEIKSPYEPQLESEEDLKYFSEEFTSMNISAYQHQNGSVNYQNYQYNQQEIPLSNAHQRFQNDNLCLQYDSSKIQNNYIIQVDSQNTSTFMFQQDHDLIDQKTQTLQFQQNQNHQNDQIKKQLSNPPSKFDFDFLNFSYESDTTNAQTHYFEKEHKSEQFDVESVLNPINFSQKHIIEKDEFPQFFEKYF